MRELGAGPYWEGTMASGNLAAVTSAEISVMIRAVAVNVTCLLDYCLRAGVFGRGVQSCRTTF